MACKNVAAGLSQISDSLMGFSDTMDKQNTKRQTSQLSKMLAGKLGPGFENFETSDPTVLNALSGFMRATAPDPYSLQHTVTLQDGKPVLTFIDPRKGTISPTNTAVPTNLMDLIGGEGLNVSPVSVPSATPTPSSTQGQGTGVGKFIKDLLTPKPSVIPSNTVPVTPSTTPAATPIKYIRDPSTGKLIKSS